MWFIIVGLRRALLLSAILLICFNSAADDSAINYGAFFNNQVSITETQAAQQVVINALSFARKSWTDVDIPALVMVLNVKGSKKKTQCRFQLQQTAIENRGFTRVFSAELAMQRNKKGVVKNPTAQQYCAHKVTVDKVYLHAFNKKILGLEVAFSPQDSYKALIQREGSRATQVLAGNIHSNIASSFGLKVLPDSAFNRLAKPSVWGQALITSSDPAPSFTQVQPSAAGGIVAKDGTYTGLMILRQTSGNACMVSLLQGQVSHQGNAISFEVGLQRPDEACAMAITQIADFTLYALSATQLGIAVTFDDNTWLRATLPHLRGEQLTPKATAQNAQYLALFAQPSESEGVASAAKKPQSSASKQLTAAEFWAPERWNIRPWQEDPKKTKGHHFKHGVYDIFVAKSDPSRVTKLSTPAANSERFFLKVSHTEFGVDLDFYGHCAAQAQLYLGAYYKLPGHGFLSSYQPHPTLQAFYDSNDVTDLPAITILLDYAQRAINNLCAADKLTTIRLLVDHDKYPNLKPQRIPVALENDTLYTLPLIGGTYVNDGRVSLSNGFVEQEEDGQLPVKFALSYAGFTVEHDSWCNAQAELNVRMEQQYDSQLNQRHYFTQTQYLDMMTAVATVYEQHCPGVQQVQLTYTDSPSRTYCLQQPCNRLVAHKSQSWQSKDIPWEALDYDTNYASLLAFFYAGKRYQVEYNNSFLSRFYVLFFDAYSQTCRRSITDPIKSTISFNNTSYEGDKVVAQESLGSYVIYTEREHTKLLTTHWNNIGYTGKQRYNFFIHEATEDSHIYRYIRKYGCDSEQVTTMALNMVEKAKLPIR